MVMKNKKGKRLCFAISLLVLCMPLVHCGLLEEDKNTNTSKGTYSPWASRVISPPWATEVIDVHYGADAGFGQKDFPDVVLGPPWAGGTQASSLDVLSLGDGGWITLGFSANYCILDGDADDFTICENVFYVAGDPNNRFIETARVAVSQDGEEFYEFPWSYNDQIENLGDPLRYTGLAGVEPTLEGNTPDTVGGDRFDLAKLGLTWTWARYVRITDTNGVPPDPGDAFGGGYGQAGFDLDAVGAIHLGSGNQCQ